jgi:hypothetical protein
MRIWGIFRTDYLLSSLVFEITLEDAKKISEAELKNE